MPETRPLTAKDRKPEVGDVVVFRSVGRCEVIRVPPKYRILKVRLGGGSEISVSRYALSTVRYESRADGGPVVIETIPTPPTEGE